MSSLIVFNYILTLPQYGNITTKGKSTQLFFEPHNVNIKTDRLFDIFIFGPIKTGSWYLFGAGTFSRWVYLVRDDIEYDGRFVSPCGQVFSTLYEFDAGNISFFNSFDKDITLSLLIFKICFIKAILYFVQQENTSEFRLFPFLRLPHWPHNDLGLIQIFIISNY